MKLKLIITRFRACKQQRVKKCDQHVTNSSASVIIDVVEECEIVIDENEVCFRFHDYYFFLVWAIYIQKFVWLTFGINNVVSIRHVIIIRMTLQRLQLTISITTKTVGHR